MIFAGLLCYVQIMTPFGNICESEELCKDRKMDRVKVTPRNCFGRSLQFFKQFGESTFFLSPQNGMRGFGAEGERL